MPALWILLLPLLVFPFRRTWWTALVSLTPFLALVAIGVAAWQRGMLSGFWLAPWEVAAALAALGLAFFGLGGGLARRSARGASRSRPARQWKEPAAVTRRL